MKKTPQEHGAPQIISITWHPSNQRITQHQVIGIAKKFVTVGDTNGITYRVRMRDDFTHGELIGYEQDTFAPRVIASDAALLKAAYKRFMEEK